MLHHNLPGFAGFFDGLAPDDMFAAGLGTGDFNGDGRHDLAIGVPRKDFLGRRNVGAVFVLYGTDRGLDSEHPQLWMQEDLVSFDLQSDPGDHFGLSLSGGSADCSVFTLCMTLALDP